MLICMEGANCFMRQGRVFAACTYGQQLKTVIAEAIYLSFCYFAVSGKST